VTQDLKNSASQFAKTSSKVAQAVRIVEVGLRDGLQNEAQFPDAATRRELLHHMVEAGTKSIEIGAFVSPRWVPAMACSEELVKSVLADQKNKIISDDIHLSVLIPNEKGMETAVKLGVNEVAIFAACSEGFSQKNTNCSIDESFKRLAVVARKALSQNIRVRGYLSTCFGCPFEGSVDMSKVAQNVKRMLDLGIYEVSLGDTIGIASAGNVETLLNKLFSFVQPHQLAGHFHDTRGQALVNILKAYEMGITTFDSSIGGLGGCPYAPGATGNVATEDVVFLFNSLNISTGLKLDKLIVINRWLSKKMGRSLSSRVGIAGIPDKFKVEVN